MTRAKRIDYLLVILLMFASVCTFFYYFGEMDTAGLPIADPTMARAVGSMMVSYLFTSFLSGIILAARFFAHRRRTAKCVAAILWPVTMLVTMFVGMVSLLPYALFNFIRVLIEPDEGA